MVVSRSRRHRTSPSGISHGPTLDLPAPPAPSPTVRPGERSGSRASNDIPTREAWCVIVATGPVPFEPKLVRPLTLVGRHPKCDLRIPDQEVSRFHCALRIEQGRLLVGDLDSINGTYLNGKRITESPAAAGDCLTI